MGKVCILLSTYNGEKYVATQIDSILAQKNVSVTLLVRDDGSKDGTIGILQKYVSENPNIVLSNETFGQNFGVAKSFWLLLKSGEQMFPDIDYFFFADQDDYWLEDKCCRAVEFLTAYKNGPSLYFSRKKLVDEYLNPLSQKDSIRLTNTFWDFFDRSNAFGCTMCMTRRLIQLLGDDSFYEHPFLHDNYIYRLCLTANFPIVYDNSETILYRQHKNNAEGAVKRSVFRGIRRLFNKKRVHIIRDMGFYIIDKHSEIINESNKAILELLLDSEKSIKSKMKLIKLYNQQRCRTLKEKIIFSVMIITNYF